MGFFTTLHRISSKLKDYETPTALKTLTWPAKASLDALGLVVQPSVKVALGLFAAYIAAVETGVITPKSDSDIDFQLSTYWIPIGFAVTTSTISLCLRVKDWCQQEHYHIDGSEKANDEPNDLPAKLHTDFTLVKYPTLFGEGFYGNMIFIFALRGLIPNQPGATEFTFQMIAASAIALLRTWTDARAPVTSMDSETQMTYPYHHVGLPEDAKNLNMWKMIKRDPMHYISELSRTSAVSLYASDLILNGVLRLNDFWLNLGMTLISSMASGYTLKLTVDYNRNPQNQLKQSGMYMLDMTRRWFTEAILLFAGSGGIITATINYAKNNHPNPSGEISNYWLLLIFPTAIYHATTTCSKFKAPPREQLKSWCQHTDQQLAKFCCFFRKPSSDEALLQPLSTGYQSSSDDSQDHPDEENPNKSDTPTAQFNSTLLDGSIAL